MDDAKYQLYQSSGDELGVRSGCVLWGCRVIVPATGQNKILVELHEGQPWNCKMKALARSLVRWPGLDHDLEKKVKSCEPCQLVGKIPSTAPLHPWEWPAKPLTRVYVDHAGPFLGKVFLVLVDSHAKSLFHLLSRQLQSKRWGKSLLLMVCRKCSYRTMVPLFQVQSSRHLPSWMVSNTLPVLLIIHKRID